MGINVAVDPFGVFGDVLFDWDNYSQSLNPRIAKVCYVSERFDEFDSYIIGSSSAASYDPQKLGEYTGTSAYNMFHYGSDTEFDRQLVEYLLENDGDVKNIFLVLGINEADFIRTDDEKLTQHRHYKVTGADPIRFYSEYLFADLGFAREKIESRIKDKPMPESYDVITAKNGCYDKRVRDVEPIGDADSYKALHGEDFYVEPVALPLKAIDECVDNVSRISSLCKSRGVTLTVVLSPVNMNQLGAFSEASLDEYFARLAEVTDYWNFAISPLSYDDRYFYDATHTRNAAADMVLATVFGNKEVYTPENYGELWTKDSIKTVEQLKSIAEQGGKEYTQNIPILLYHHLADVSEGDSTLALSQFEHHLELITKNGYTAVTFDDVINFVEKGTPLAKNPVIITFDDGYTSNYEALSLIEKYGCRATVFAIGSSVGADKYKDTDNSVIPHFNGEQAQEMIKSGVFYIGSHTYDMHQAEKYETGDRVRKNILPFEDESDAEYISALSRDIEKQHDTFSDMGLDAPYVIAFPGGKFCTLADVVLKSYGYKVTLTTQSDRKNTVIAGLSQSLYDMGRMNINADVTDEQILDYLSAR